MSGNLIKSKAQHKKVGNMTEGKTGSQDVLFTLLIKLKYRAEISQAKKTQSQ